MTSPAIEVLDLFKHYPRVRSWRRMLRHPFEEEHVPALRGLSFSVAPGSVFGVLGPNGAGKTTLIKILTTLITPTSGTARVFGHDVVRDGARVRAKVGLVVSDERSFYWRLSVRQNLRFFATLNDFEPKESERRIDELLEVLDCREYAERPFRNLSTGIRQRVAVARALLMDPRLLLMDEPTSSMDPRAAAELRGWMLETLVRRDGKSILLVTHDPLEAEFLCDEVAVLSSGRLVRTSSPAEIRALGARRTAWRLRLSGWEPALTQRAAELGFEVRSTQAANELEFEGSGVDVGPLVQLLQGEGARVHDCTRLEAPFAAGIAELLEGGADPGAAR